MTSKWVGSEGSYLTLEAFDQLIGDGLDLNGSPSELMSVPQVAKDYGLGSLTVKRDDLINSLCGGTKVRKLNYLLADGRFKKAATWHAVGSIGSGNLVTLTRFAEHLGKRLEIHCFGVPITEGTTENLSQLVMDHVNIRYYPNRIDLCFGLASYFVGQMSQVILPTGSTNGDGKGMRG